MENEAVLQVLNTRCFNKTKHKNTIAKYLEVWIKEKKKFCTRK